MTREPENNATATAAPEELAHLERVIDILKSLVRLIHGRKLYAENNPRLQEFEEGLSEDLARYFKLEDELVLVVEQYAIRWRDEVVYENEKREESIAFLLHKDGIGEISIGAGALGDELNHLVQILTDEFHRAAPDEDVVTRFWNADFEHISYRVLDDYLAGDYTELAALADPEEVPTEDHEELMPSLADRGREIISPRESAESIDEYLRRQIMRTCDSEDETERLMRARMERKRQLNYGAPRNAAASGSGGKVQTYRRVGKKVGRNDPCPCGSGKKYKQCCLRSQPSA